MDGEPIRVLRLVLSDAELAAAILALGGSYGSFWHPRAWDFLTTELDRRQRGHERSTIRMPGGVFDTLPSPVQGMLRPNVTRELRLTA
jgi:hypothetical protein